MTEPDGLRRVRLGGVSEPRLVGRARRRAPSARAVAGRGPGGGSRRAARVVDRALAGPPLEGAAELLAPVDTQEVWACGVTYRRSATAREEESVVADVYSLVYEAERPELFLKATSQRVPAPGAALRVRADSGWDVPEPELALVLDAEGVLVGYLVADDVSSRAIEGANPLYLPQAKIYDDALGLSGTIVLARDLPEEVVRSAAITLEIHREGGLVFEGQRRWPR
jgi:2-dehydro-3-deoxy-D-arabinonate dehydratase